MAGSVQFSPLDPDWLAHRYVEGKDAFRFIRVPRADRRSVPFLTDANLGDRPGPYDVRADEILNQFRAPRVGWLFHSAFCGSTMLSQALDIGGVASSLSEPVLLNDIVGFRRRGADARAVARLADGSIRLLGRPYGDETAVVVKPSNVVNPLAELLLALNRDAPAIFLFAPLESFLISVARKGLPCRLWVRELLEGYLREKFVDFPFSAEDYFRQSDLQIAAIGWLAQHAYFARLAATLGRNRLRSLDADRMIADPTEAIAAVSRHFGIDISTRASATIAAGPAFTRHSKSGVAYSPETRRADYAQARAAYGEEIETVVAWARQVAELAGISFEAPNALLA